MKQNFLHLIMNLFRDIHNMLNHCLFIQCINSFILLIFSEVKQQCIIHQISFI